MLSWIAWAKSVVSVIPTSRAGALDQILDRPAPGGHLNMPHRRRAGPATVQAPLRAEVERRESAPTNRNNRASIEAVIRKRTRNSAAAVILPAGARRTPDAVVFRLASRYGTARKTVQWPP
jgi:hypothetical protein